MKTLQLKVLLVLTVMQVLPLQASDISDVLPLTNRIILVRFDDGMVTYPNDLQVDRLNLELATTVSSYSLSSIDDDDYLTEVNPADLGRKSKGNEFVKDAPWGVNSSDPRSKPWSSEHYIYLFLDKALKPGKTYNLHTSELATNGSDWTFTYDVKKLRSEAVHVNTIGYSTDAPKYGYIYQWMGDKGGLDLTLYAGKSFHLYRKGGADPVYSGTIAKRKSATNAETSHANDTPDRNFLGAEVYECDFSEVTADGEYHLVVEGIGCSYPFKIGKDALWDAYYTCGRALYYQRSGIRLAPPYTDNGYTRPVNQNPMVTSDDGTSFEGMLLYSNYSYMEWDDDNSGGSSMEIIRDSAIGKPLDVAGWYHDAGDWDSYYTHHRIPILLMTTFEYAPERFADGDLNIPESGNGVPDIVDEASWLIKFNYRLRKELIAKGYSDGGLGGARICADVFTYVDGNAESNAPSWREYRRTVVSQVDAFMTYIYAGQAAQYAYILRQLGKDPHNDPVEMLDHVDFESMSRDVVDWEKEAREAYAWASAPENQPASGNNYPASLETFKMYGASSLFRLTNDEVYHTDAITELEKVKSKTNLQEDERWGVYTYLMADNYGADRPLQASLKNVALNTARISNTNAIKDRACRWGGSFSMPMLVGQGTTPWMFESIVAYGLSGDKSYSDAVHTTADYFLGTNPMHTTWATHLGPRPAPGGFHLDSRYNNNWDLYPGFVPYGPWSMDPAYGYEPYIWTIDGVSMEGGHGTWNKDWANFSQYPLMEVWPGHERWNNNIHAPMSSENTVHQNAVYVGLTYGFVNARQNTNAEAVKSIGTITMDRSSLTLTEQGATDTLMATVGIDDAGFGMLQWGSSDSRIAHVDGQGRVTGVTSGNCTITCSTLDGSAAASCEVSCTWVETAADSIWIKPDSLNLVEGQTAELTVFFSPVEVTNKFVDWRYSQDGIAEVDELGMLAAIAPGIVHVIATSLNGGKVDSCYVEVMEAVDYIIADFDDVIPVLTEPQPDVPQLYTPEGSADIEAVNPLPSLSNESPTAVRYNRPDGDWRLLGMVLPTEDFQDLSKFAQFQFKYFGSDINDFFIQLVPESGDNLEISATVEGEDCWKLFTIDLDLSFPLKQMNVFPNPQSNPDSISCYFDDFILAGKSVEWFSDLSISDHLLDMDSGDEFILIAEAEGNPFSWISSDADVLTVDQEGRVTAVSKGTAVIRAVPLYGVAQECIVKVDGGDDPVPEDYEKRVILDFEAFELDWTTGYGGFAWASNTFGKVDNPDKGKENGSDKVVSWDRDGTNYGGGLGIQFPVETTTGWERFSLQAYADIPITSILIELLNGDDKVGGIETQVNIPAGEWTQLMFDLVDMGAAEVTFNKIQLLYAVGTLDVLKVYTDNVWLEKGVPEDTTVVVSLQNTLNPDDGPDEYSAVRIYPNPVIDQFTIQSITPVEKVDIINVRGEPVMQVHVNRETSVSIRNLDLNKGIYLVRVADMDGNITLHKTLILKK